MLTRELIREIHDNAVAHGWWDPEPDRATIAALFHSELSEALQEYRNGMGMVYGDEKPEGIAVELADLVIRILDWCGAARVDIVKEYGLWDDYQIEIKFTLPELIAMCHSDVSEWHGDNDEIWRFAAIIRSIEVWLESRGIDLWEVVQRKHEYNKTRPYRHGGKRC